MYHSALPTDGRSMSRIVLVSNRVADLSKANQAGGVAVAIADTLRTRKGLWLGWSGKIGDRSEELRTTPDFSESGGTVVATLPLSSRENDDYYIGYSNNVLWPVSVSYTHLTLPTNREV